MMRSLLGAFVVVLVALGGGWIWGSSGRWDLDRRLQVSELQNDVREARSSVLAARIDLYNVNFGAASRQLENARSSLHSAGEQLTRLGRLDDVKRLDVALGRISDAQRMALKLDQGANSAAAEALVIIEGVLKTVSH